MEQPERALKWGTGVRTHSKLDTTAGFFVTPEHLALRKPDLCGVVVGVVAGHGGDVYWVIHEGDAKAAAYLFTEFELEALTVVWPVTYELDRKSMCHEFASFGEADKHGKLLQKLASAGVSEVLIQKPIFEEREPQAEAFEVTVDRPTAWDRLGADDL